MLTKDEQSRQQSRKIRTLLFGGAETASRANVKTFLLKALTCLLSGFWLLVALATPASDASSSPSLKPYATAVDSAGNLFISDYATHRIYKLTANGIFIPVAGTGVAGYSGDGGAATNAALYYPDGSAVDSGGNLFIADEYNHRIRKVSNGIITTVAGTGAAGYNGDGGAATSATLNYPSGVAVDSAGNLFIADSHNHRIRKVASNGIISTVAGTGVLAGDGDGGPATSARLAYPTGVVIDSTGNLFIADTYNYCIRKVAPNGIISTVAGTMHTAGFGGDGGVAASAQLDHPYAVAVDSTGNLFIADTDNNRVRKVANGIITTVAGTGVAGFSGDGGAATSAALDFPTGVTVDSAGNLFIADHNNHRIRKVLYDIMTTAVGPEKTVAANGRIAFVSNRDGNEEIYTMNSDGTGVARLTNNPAIDRDPVWSPDGTRIAFASTRDGSGDIYIMNADGSNMNRLTTGGNKGNPPTWSPDGSRLAYASTQDGNFEIYAINANGTGAVRLTNHPQKDDFPTWSPDGTRIAFHSTRDGSTAEIYVMNVDGTGVTRLTSNTADDVFPKWSPDGTRIVYRSETDGNAEIYTMNPDGSGGKRLTFRPFGFDTYPAWSPDGRQITFVSDQDGNSEIYTMDAEGVGRWREAGHQAVAAGDWKLGDFNGDGRTDVYFWVNTTGDNHLFLSNNDGTSTQIVNPIAVQGINGGDQWTVGDFNGDGRTDAYFWWRTTGENRLFLSNGNGSFGSGLGPIDVTAINGGDQWTVGDFNGDGQDDVYFWWKTTGDNRLFLSNGGGTSTQIVNPIGAGAINGGDQWTVGDFNGDGRDDVYFWWKTTGDNRLFLSNGNGTFTQFTNPIAVQGINGGDQWTVGDFNGDGRTDAYFWWKATGDNRLFLSSGNGTFGAGLGPADAGEIRGSAQLTVGDLNGDGASDVITYLNGTVDHRNGNFELLLSDGVSKFSLEARHVNFDAGNWDLGDFNGDGKADLIRYINGAFDIYLTEGTGPVKRLTTGAALDNAPAWQPVLDGIGRDADHDGYSTTGGDCDDTDPDIHPGATEVCDGVDDDCDGQIDENLQQIFYRDSDGDGFGTTTITTQACAIPTGYVVNSSDCNDSNTAIKPNATESCNNVDDDCDGQVDEGFPVTTFYRDSDGDGFGNIAVTTQACSAPTGYVALPSSGPYAGRFDCDDTKSSLNPAHPALSVSDGCDGVDNDCDGLFDENAPQRYSCWGPNSWQCGYVSSLISFYRDADGDGYGAGTATLACKQPKGYAPKGDCNDSNAAINPKAAESCNGVDDNCNAQIDEQTNIALVYRDADGDGYGDPNVSLAGACSPQTGYVSRSGDCNDMTSAIKPGAPEVCGDGVDWNCDGKDPECPPSATLVGLEATQVVQDWKNSVKLISGKPTYVRAHIDFPAAYVQAHLQSPADAPLKVRGTLEGIRVRTDGSETPVGTIPSKDEELSCVKTAANAELCDVESRRGVYNGSLNFQVPSEWLAQGILKLKFSGQTIAGSFSQPLVCGEPAEEGGTGANCEVVVRVQAPTTLKVKFVKVTWSDSSRTYTPTEEDIKELHKRLQAIYPASVIDYTIGELGSKEEPILPTETVINPKCVEDGYSPLLCLVNEKLVLARTLDRLLNPDDYFRRYYGVLKGPDVGGLAVNSWVSSGTMPDSPVSFGSTRHAHEIAHSLGLLHAEFCGATGGEPFPFTTVINGETVATLGPMDAGRDALVFGLNTSASGTPLAIDPSRHFELMSYCGNTKPSGFENTFKWISTYNYKRLGDTIRFDALQIPAIQSAIIMAMGGSVNLADGAVTFAPFVNVESVVAPEMPPPGDYTLQLRDPNGNVLQEVPFQPDEMHADLPVGATPTGESTSGSFFITVPANEAIKQVVVLRQGNPVGARSSTPHAPQVTVLSPNGGEDLSGETATLQWTGSDADGDALSYIVQYSSDDGATWETLAVDRPETSVVVSVSALAGGSQGRIRVLASDGFNSTNDQSDGVFTVANKAPLVSLLSPADGRLFVTGEVVALRASVIDKEDGELSGDQVVWTSDLDGVLGTGTDFSAPQLSEGEHIVSVTATDSSGYSTAESIRIRVMSTTPAVLSDLSLSQTVNAEAILVGNDATFTVSVKNTGPDVATDVTFISSIEGNVASVTAAADQGTCQVTGSTVTCSLGNLADDATATVTVTATTTATGAIVYIATVSGTETDPALADNTDTKTITVLLDSDSDGTPDDADGCPADPAKTAPGSCGCGVADTDSDGDGAPDCTDACPSDAGKTGPGLCGCGVADTDADGDGALDCVDNCPTVANFDQSDNEGDGQGDACDTDLDGDGVANSEDNCPLVANASQMDLDGDGFGDICDEDVDNDGIGNVADNCIVRFNPDQIDFDGDRLGDACDGDVDADGVANGVDACPFTALQAIVDPASGCAITQLCPCNGSRGTTELWKNHGKYVSCVSKSAESFVGLGLMTPAQKDATVSAAAQSICGK
ncbi:MAG: PD40 domain-containing protein [Deltaproteobacteria bacterium]|nr:PD40 domain-containing protein [Deltaproteobacteria bacterium]